MGCQLYNEFNFFEAKPVWESGKREEKNQTLIFRATVPAGKIKINVTAHSSYRLWVNGKFTKSGPARTAHGFFRCDTLDIELNEEKNSIVFLVAGYNINSYCSTDELPFLCAEIIRDGIVLFATGTDKNFETVYDNRRRQKVQRYSFQRQFVENYDSDTDIDTFIKGGENKKNPIKTETVSVGIFIERTSPFSDNSEIKAEKIVTTGSLSKKFKYKKFDDRSLKAICDKLGGFPEKELSEVPVNELRGLKYKVKNSNSFDVKPIEIGNKCFAIYDMGRNTTGYIHLIIGVENDAEIYASFSEILREGTVPPDDNGCANTVKWHLKGGKKYDLVSYEPYCYRFIQIVAVKSDIEVLGVSQYKEARDPATLENRKSFETKNLNTIYDAACESFMQNATDIFMDCPGRERAGWLCDSFFTGRTERALTGTALTEHDFLENFILPDSFGFIPNGILPMCYPADHNDGVYIHNWALWYVLELREYYKFTGDEKLKEAARERILKLRDFTATYENENGLLEKLGSWIFVEWSEANSFTLDVNYPSNMLYSVFLDAVAELYGDEACSEKAARIREQIRKEAFDGKFFLDHAVRNKNGELNVQKDCTETCQYYALFSKTATKESHPEFYNMMINEFGPIRDKNDNYPEVWHSNAFIGNYLRLIILKENGLYNKLKQEIEDFFLPMAQATGTLWENMTDNASCNHGFASYVATILNEIE